MADETTYEEEADETRVCIIHLSFNVCRACAADDHPDLGEWSTDSNWIDLARTWHLGHYRPAVHPPLIFESQRAAVYWQWLWQKASNSVLDLQSQLRVVTGQRDTARADSVSLLNQRNEAYAEIAEVRNTVVQWRERIARGDL